MSISVTVSGTGGVGVTASGSGAVGVTVGGGRGPQGPAGSGGTGGGASSWDDLTGKPATFAPSAHAGSHATGGSDPLTLAIGQITGLQTALDGKQAAGSYAAANHGHAATAITFDPTGLNNITTATVQAALAEVDADLEERISATQFSGLFSTGLTVVGGIVSVLFGTTSTTVCVGNDSRLSDSRTPTAGSVTDTSITSSGLSASSINWGGIAAWAPSTAYAKGDLVEYLGVAYRRTAAGTSGTTFSASNWQQVTPTVFVASQITSGTLGVDRLPARARVASRVYLWSSFR